MEENKTTTENNKPSYEQLEQIALQLQQKALQAEARLRAINLTTMRLEYLFKVLDRAKFFPDQFVNDCSTEIVDFLEVKESDTESQAIDTPEE